MTLTLYQVATVVNLSLQVDAAVGKTNNKYIQQQNAVKYVVQPTNIMILLIFPFKYK